MQFTSLGKTGVQVSRLCMGSMQFGWTADEQASFAVLDAFAAAGGNFIDSADIYSNWVPGNSGGDAEAIIGRWMKSRANRDSMVIATKLRGRMWEGEDGDGLGRAHVIRACEDSLRRLQIETIDLYQAHWFDERVPIDETLRAFEDLVKAGKVRHIGASNYRPHLLKEALDVAKQHGLPAYATLQPHHSLVHRKEYEAELAGICLEYGLGVIPYSPLAGGFLTGKYTKGGQRVRSERAGGARQYFTDEGWAVLAKVREVALVHSTTPAAVALAWQLTVPGITAPIVGANTPGQFADQLPALELQLSPEELATLNAVSEPYLQNGEDHQGS
ncbi:MAG: aldo/keto reductase [Dehalococcoidia bacterium]